MVCHTENREDVEKVSGLYVSFYVRKGGEYDSSCVGTGER